MKMAKASERDMDMAMKLCTALEDHPDTIAAIKDAARYRWLRENISDDMQWYLLGTHGMGADDLDGAIDAAMLKTQNA